MYGEIYLILCEMKGLQLLDSKFVLLQPHLFGELFLLLLVNDAPFFERLPDLNRHNLPSHPFCHPERSRRILSAGNNNPRCLPPLRIAMRP